MQGPGAAHPRHEDLLAQREWIRGLARALAADESSADDLEQETLAAALRAPPPGGGFPRAWLATVLRNFARRGRRDAGRARRREEAAARPEAGDDAAAVVARAEAHGRLVDAVLALPEPARTAVLLRFYDGLPPREVARCTGVPVETARTRLKRALADLRGRLGGERGREGMLGLLAPLLRPEKGIAAGTAGGIAMGAAARVAFAAGAAALATVGVVAWRTAGTGDGVPPAAAVAVAPRQAGPGPAAFPTPPPAPPAPATTVSSPPPPQEPEEVEEPITAPPPGPLEVSFPNGATLARWLDEVARLAGLGLEYRPTTLRGYCEGTELPPFRLEGIPLRDVMTILLRNAPRYNATPPEPGKVLGWEVRGKTLRVLLQAPPPPDPKKAEEEAARRKAQEEDLLKRLKAGRTTFVFDGQNLPEAFSFISAQQGVNIVVNDPDMATVQEVTVKLSLKDVPVTEALDELVRLDPDLLWELRGNVVLVRRK